MHDVCVHHVSLLPRGRSLTRDLSSRAVHNMLQLGARQEMDESVSVG